MTGNEIKGDTPDARVPLDSQIDAVWSTICRRLKKQTTDFNSKKGEVHLNVDIGRVRGLANVGAFGGDQREITRVGFELVMNTGGLAAWSQENNIRTKLSVDSIVDDDELIVRYEGEPVATEELVDRVLKQWRTRYQSGRRWSFIDP